MSVETSWSIHSEFIAVCSHVRLVDQTKRQVVTTANDATTGRWRVTQPPEDGEKGQVLAFEAFKHLTTLNAGSIVLIGTFLGDIFPHDKHGNLTIDQLTTGLIAASFLLFGVSLVASTFSMYQFAHFETWWSGMIKSSPSGNWFFDGFVTLARLVAGSVFFLGVVCFGAAVLWSLWQ